MNTRLPDADGTHRPGTTYDTDGPGRALAAPRRPLPDAVTPSAHPVPPSRLHEARRFMRDRLVDIDHAVQAMLTEWVQSDLPPDLLAPTEYPFPSSLDDFQALLSGCHEYLSRALEHDEDEAARIAHATFPDADVVDAAGLTGATRGRDHVTWEDVARSLLTRHGDLELAEARHRAASHQEAMTPGYRAPGHSHNATVPCTPQKCTGHPDWQDIRAASQDVDVVHHAVGWCYRDGQPFESTTDPSYRGYRPICEHAGDPPIDRSGQDWTDYLDRVDAIRHIPGIGNAAGA
jgi:hypothetical protein